MKKIIMNMIKKIFLLTLFSAAINAAFCFSAMAFSVDYDGDGVADAVGSTGNVPMPSAPTPVYNSNSSTRENTSTQRATYQQKAPKPKAPSSEQMAQNMIMTTLMEGLLTEIFAPPPTGPSPEELLRLQEEQRKLEEERLKQFLKSNSELTGRLKGFDAVPDKGIGTVDAGGLKLKMPGNGPQVHQDFFGTPGSIKPTAELLREDNPVESDFSAIRESQDQMSALQNKENLSDAEQKELDALTAKRNALWSKLSAMPDLTQEERERLKLRMYVAPKSDNNFMVDADALIAREQWSDPYLDVIGAATKSGAESYGIGMGEEAGKMLLMKKMKKATGYSQLLLAGKWVADTPQTTAEKALTVVDFALDKAPPVDAAINAVGAGTRQAVVRYWASNNTIDHRPIESAMNEWDSWYVDQGEWTRAALDLVGAGKFK